MPTRVVVYAEGARELFGEFVLEKAPGSPLSESDFGAAHFLVRRTIDHLVPQPLTLQFEAPLNLTTTRPPRGSDLLDRKSLRRLLAWVPHRRPDLAVVLVDEDGVDSRLSTLRSYLEADWSPPVAIGVAVREFESWLIGDMQAVREVLEIKIDEPREPEQMKPGEAKALLDGWLEERNRSKDGRGVRARIAARLRLDALVRTSRSFRRFHEELGASLALVPPSRG